MGSKLYTLPDCTACVPAKDLIKSRELGIEIVDDLSQFPMGIRSVPCLQIDEDMVFGGEKVLKVLKEYRL